MSEIWNTLIDIQNTLIEQFNDSGIELHDINLEKFNKPGWINRVWTSEKYRRAHIDVIDARDSRGLWMMHCCIFPHIHNPAPIYGFDVVAGRNKITGFFHDFTSAGDPKHPLIEWFAEEVSNLSWRKVRVLPDWAERIFTPHIITASNVQDIAELNQIFEIATTTVCHYIENIDETNHTSSSTKEEQNFYLQNQKLNPHNPKVMMNLGLSESEVTQFINECMFPEIV